LRASYIRHAVQSLGKDRRLTPEDARFLAEDAGLDAETVTALLAENGAAVDE
jgi:hypothetical protein